MFNYLSTEWKGSNLYKAIVSLIKTEACCVCCKNPLQLPLFTTEQENAVENPTEGMVVFNTDTGEINIYDGTEWKGIRSATV